MADPRPVTLTRIDSADFDGTFTPEPLLVVGDIPAGVPEPAPTIDATPADATAVAADLQALVNALVAAGYLTP